jgi:transposase
MNASQVATQMRVSWRTVGGIVRRVVGRKLPADRLDGLLRIGIDELSYRKHHEYVTVIVDHDRQCVVWTAPGKNAATVAKFFEALGPERAGQLKVVTMDMSAAYIAAVKAGAPQAQIVFDRFHVQRLAHDALDEVRRTLTRELRDAGDKTALKDMRVILQKSEWKLTLDEHKRLADSLAENEPLFRAHMLKESLAGILDSTDETLAKTKLDQWTDWAARSRLAPFVRVGRTIRKHTDSILAYVKTRLNNGRTEGLNGKIRVITRRAFGFHCVSSLIAYITLCCGGLVLSPRH